KDSRGRHKSKHARGDRLARHIFAMEKLRRLSFVRTVLLAHRANRYGGSPLPPNEMQNFRAYDSALENHIGYFQQSHRNARIVSGERYRNAPAVSFSNGRR